MRSVARSSSSLPRHRHGDLVEHFAVGPSSPPSVGGRRVPLEAALRTDEVLL
jgi:hypothetical protein